MILNIGLVYAGVQFRRLTVLINLPLILTWSLFLPQCISYSGLKYLHFENKESKFIILSFRKGLRTTKNSFEWPRVYIHVTL